MKYDLNSLNNEQRQPVFDTEGAVLVTAGAGSGKTRLLTHRIAYLVEEKGVKPYNILAITFTNKAANEMKERLYDMIEDVGQMWVCTFHAMCVRILRHYIHLMDYDRNFTIYGENEKEQCIKKIIKKLEIEDDVQKKVIKAISDAKTKALSPDEYYKTTSFLPDAELIRTVYDSYEKELRKSNALDYDDLLNKAYLLLCNFEEARDYFQNKFWYIHVDEFQDTNQIQYDIVRVLSAKHKNILVVGDEDQSIYGWRGAKAANIMGFIKDFKCKVYKLEQNYRSTDAIIDLANKLIQNNSARLEKKLWTEKKSQFKPEYFQAQSDGDEAQFVVATISNLVNYHGYSLSDFAVLMRLNALSRSIEEKLIQYTIPHKIFGGFKFYERKEIKDLLAYVRIMVNPKDRDAIVRVINFPKRGIGPGSVTQLINYSDVENKDLYDVIFNIESNDDLPSSLIKKVLPFTNVLKCLENAKKNGQGISETLRYIIKLIDLKTEYGEATDENESRKNNIRELVSGAEVYERDNGSADISDYLQNVSLYSDTDDMDEGNNSINLATIHAAKGLEFKVVFVIGLEEGLFPDSRKDGTDEMQEERRLMYVAITRAKERLYLTSAKSRFRYGQRTMAAPSRFLIETNFVKKQENPYAAYAERDYSSSSRYGGDRSYSSYGDSYNKEEVPLYFNDAAPAGNTPKLQEKDESAFRAGAKVRHKKFGDGTILSVNNDGDTCLEVEFPAVGKMILMLKYAPLEIID